MISPEDFEAISLTFRLALLSIIILLLIGSPLAWWLARSQSRFKTLIEALVALPLVLPPTVLGFYLLVLMQPDGFLSQLFNTQLVFSFSGLVVGSVIYSLPFVVQPLQNTFKSIGQRPIEIAACLRASPWDRFIHVILPLSRPGYLTAIVLGFAHIVGEFGVVLMIGGNIPGKTQVLSIAIYDHVESLEYAQAHWLSGGLLIFSFILLIIVYWMNRSQKHSAALL